MVHSHQKFPNNDTYSRRPKNPAQMEFVQDLQGLWGKRTASVLSARAEFVVQSTTSRQTYFVPTRQIDGRDGVPLHGQVLTLVRTGTHSDLFDR